MAQAAKSTKEEMETTHACTTAALTGYPHRKQPQGTANGSWSTQDGIGCEFYTGTLPVGTMAGLSRFRPPQTTERENETKAPSS